MRHPTVLRTWPRHPRRGPDANESGPFDAGFCATGACRRVFVTATQMGDGNIGGLSGADGICQGAADVQGIGGIWKAWLSDATSAPSNRFVLASVPYRLLDGTLIANNWADLTSGSLGHPIDVDETLRHPLATLEVWTGTLPAGLGTGATCSDWTNASVNMTGTVGLTNASNAQWSNGYVQFCDRTNGASLLFLTVRHASTCRLQSVTPRQGRDSEWSRHGLRAASAGAMERAPASTMLAVELGGGHGSDQRRLVARLPVEILGRLPCNRRHGSGTCRPSAICETLFLQNRRVDFSKRESPHMGEESWKYF
jgi:hypothetical protein